MEFELIVLAKANSEWLDRPELEIIKRAFLPGKYDAIIYDDSVG